MKELNTIDYRNFNTKNWTFLDGRIYPTQLGATREANKLLKKYPGNLLLVYKDNKYVIAGDDQFAVAYMK